MKAILTSPAHLARILSLLVCLVVAVACKEKEADKVGPYSADEVGWSTTIPAGWKEMSAAEKAKATDAGQKAVEKATGGSIDRSKLKELLNLKKDQFNNFLSTIEPYDEAADGPWEENHKKVATMILETYKSAGIKTGKFVNAKEEIDGLEFNTTEIEIMHPTSGKVLMTQKMFSRLLNGYDFGMTASTNNDKDRDALVGMVKASKFSKRK